MADLLCKNCGDSFSGRKDRKWCSVSCANKAEKLRRTPGELQARRDRAARSRLANRDSINERGRQYYAENKDRWVKWAKANPDKRRARQAEYVARNPHKAKELARRSYLLKRDEIKARTKEWAQNNPERKSVANMNARHKRRATLSSAQSFWISERSLNRLLIRNNGRCHYCGCVLTVGGSSTDSLNWDHIIPISRGGSHGEGNLAPSCRSCNLSKHTKTIMEWKLWLAKLPA